MFRIQHLRTTLTLFVGAFLALMAFAKPVQAQTSGRMRVMVVNLTPQGGANDRFGRDLAKELRDRIDLPTHVAMSDDDIDDAAKEYDTRLRDLNCILAQQLAMQIQDQVGMVLCGQYTESGDNVQYTAEFVTIPGMETFPVESHSVAARDIDTAANQIMDFFQATIDKVSQITFCGMEYNSSNWEAAADDCQKAVELAPESVEARSALARTYLEMERWQDSLDQFHVLLEQDPYNSVALQSAGYVASQLGNKEEARDYYSRYLELNPDNVAVRIRVARDLAEAGDDLGGMQLLEVGLTQDPSNVDLHEQYGSMAARAALALQSQQPAPEAGQPRRLDPQVAELFRKAVESLTMVLDAKGQESLPQYVQSVMAAHIQLGELDEAIALGQRGTQYFPRNAQVRSQLANAYNQAGQVDQAISTLREALDLDPELPNAYARMGQWLLAAGRLDEATDAFKTAVERGEQPPDQLATLIFGYGYNTLDQKNGDLDGAIAAYDLAREFDISPELRSQINFFHGYALYRKGEAIQAPQTVESAQASLPVFQQALAMFNQAREYGDRNPGSNLAQFVEGSNTYVQIQQSIIQRGSR